METAQQFEFERISRPLSEQSGPRRRSTRKEKEKKEKKKPASQVYTPALYHHHTLSSLLPIPQPVQPSLPLSQESHQSVPLPAPPGIQDIPEAGYQMIGVSKPDTPVSPPITPHSLPQTFAGGTYAEINDPQLESIRQQAQMNHSEIRSTPSELNPGSITPHDQLLSEDDTDAELATYAQVDMQKKRESRRKKREQTRSNDIAERRNSLTLQSPTAVGDQEIDSWV